MLKRDGIRWRLNGKKSFCSGANDSDRQLIYAKSPEHDQPVIAVIPTKRPGIFIQDDWDSFGQRQTDSGTVIFNEVLLKEEEVMNFYQQNPANMFPTIRTHIAQTILIHVLLGVAEGAFVEAKEYTKKCHSSLANFSCRATHLVPKLARVLKLSLLLELMQLMLLTVHITLRIDGPFRDHWLLNQVVLYPTSEYMKQLNIPEEKPFRSLKEKEIKW
jgi:alkylation response protein AidB-like acyl-CoA dehydrogenase